MPSKPNGNKWTDVQMAIAAISVTSAIAFWNMFAGIDKIKADEKAKVEQQAALVSTATAIVEVPPTPVITMPPTGYKILFGGAAPQPQVIVVRKPGGGGGNEDNGNNGGGGAAATTDTTVTTTSSS